MFRAFTRLNVGGTLALGLVAVFACSAGEKASDNSVGNGGTSVGGDQGGSGPGTGGSGAESTTGGSIGVGAMGGADDGPPGPAWIPSDLPEPWQYYDEGDDRAYKDPELGDDVRDQFGGSATTDGAPMLVYPLNGAMHPLNLGDITFQWSQGAASNTVFRIDAVGADGRNSRFYVPCTASDGNCTYAMPESDWLWLAADYANLDVTITISGTDGAGGPVATSEPITAYYSPEPVYGALYYWAAAAESLKRATFGSKKAVPYISPESDTNQFKCVACHSVSRNGKVIAFAVSNIAGESVAAIQTAPTEDPTNPYVEPEMGTTPYAPATAHALPGDVGSVENQPLDHFGHMPALSPDGALAVINGAPVTSSSGDDWAFVEIRDTLTGDTIRKYNIGEDPFGVDNLPILPEWSPDGSSIVAALTNRNPNNSCLWTYVTCNSPIAVLPVIDGSSFGEPTIITQNTDPEYYDYYPTWSPDGEWVVFQTAKRVYQEGDPTVADNPRSLSNKNGVIRMVRSTGGPYACPGPDCIELTNGTQYTPEEALAGTGKGSTWPKFTPFAQGEDENIMFVSLTSHMNYGFLATTGQSQLWMFAVDISKVGQGDPSYAPIWLPYQDFTDGSLTPYWTETLPCQQDPEGGCKGCVSGEECVVNSGNECECHATVVK